ncbi:MAG TPA: adenylate/guanylate cyclase domain-containing protein [Acidimicrobiales bacterium]|nr:adenylate/guanylate cyclase domain-containing protein [Acidimicrobiales bacterium]
MTTSAGLPVPGPSSGQSPSDPAGLPTGRIVLLMWTRLAVANLVGAVIVFVFFQRIAPAPQASSQIGHDRDMLSLVVFVLYMGGTALVFGVVGQKLYGRQYRWVEEGRTPTPAERETALREPFRLAAGSFAAWMGAAVLFSGLNMVFGNPFVVVVRIFVGIVFGGLATSVLSYLLVERTLRPVFAVVLAGGVRRDRYLGVRPRLMLSWGLGSGVPLLGIALAVVGPSRPDDPRGAVAFLTAVGMLGGWTSMFVAARSVADPIESVRAAVGRVGEGDLGVEVTVDDGGEVGLLQSGFNQMVSGLRERQHLRDLFGRHVGDEVARQALERDAALGGGEQRDASALFVDLIGSTALAATRPAQEVVATLNALFDAVVRVVGAEGGWVNKFEGDGALCVFGAPADQPDHAARALRAARLLRDELARLRHDGGIGALDAGIGVSSGTVVAGNVGAEERYEYTVIGDPVNEAARLTELAKTRPERVLAGERAVAAAGPAGEAWVLAGEFELRGRGPVCAYAPAS